MQVIDPAHVGAEATSVAVSSNANVFATGGTDNLVKLWDMRTGKLLQDGVGHSGAVSGGCCGKLGWWWCFHPISQLIFPPSDSRRQV